MPAVDHDSHRLLTLTCHPSSVGVAVEDIRVTIKRLASTQIMLMYWVRGDISKVCVPQLAISTRQDELWRHTCAELFISALDKQDYCEFNFSPSTQWAAYGFARYRQGMHPIECIPPIITLDRSLNHFSLGVQLELPPGLASFAQMRVGLSMVIEESSGQCTYWAISHVGQAPDFHHPESFVVNL